MKINYPLSSLVQFSKLNQFDSFELEGSILIKLIEISINETTVNSINLTSNSFAYINSDQFVRKVECELIVKNSENNS